MKISEILEIADSFHDLSSNSSSIWQSVITENYHSISKKQLETKLREIVELMPEIKIEIKRGIIKCTNMPRINLSVELLEKLNKWVEE